MRKSHDNGWVAIGDGIVIGGSISFSRFGEFVEMRHDIEEAVVDGKCRVMDIRPLEFISSSGIGVLATICKRCQRSQIKGVQLFVNPSLQWQSNMARNLKKIWFDLELIGVMEEKEFEFLP